MKYEPEEVSEREGEEDGDDEKVEMTRVFKVWMCLSSGHVGRADDLKRERGRKRERGGEGECGNGGDSGLHRLTADRSLRKR
jgi:hypothetical protein